VLVIVIGKNRARLSEYCGRGEMGLLGVNIKRQVVVNVKYLL
jgi:hypothetical protein